MEAQTSTANTTVLTGLARQKAYIEQKKTSGNTTDSFFITDKVMESMRDSGYRDIRKAINDLIDNSEQAGAKKIAVVTTSARGTEKNAREKISDIAVIDDGYGMYPEMLPDAVKWGGTDRHDQRDGLGRFGFGLPTAAISVTRTYDVYSKVKGGEWHKVTVDLNEITKQALQSGGNIAFTPKSEPTMLPDFIKSHIKEQWKKPDLEQGTVVHLIKADRIRSFAKPDIFQKKMMRNIGLTYRHFIPKVAFLVNGKKVEIIDPLFLKQGAIGYDANNGLFAEELEPMTISVKNKHARTPGAEGLIKLRFSTTPPTFQRDKDGEKIPTRSEIMKENNGYFIVCRAGRQIDVVRDTNYQSDNDNTTIINYDRNWAIELEFEPVLDELFGITTNKQQVEIDEDLWEVFKQNGLPAIVTALRKKVNSQRKDIAIEKAKAEEKVLDSETIMAEADKLDKPKVPGEKKDKAEAKLDAEAEQKATAEKTTPQEAKKQLEAEAESRKYKVEYTQLPSAFYEVELSGGQTRLKINTGHRFYTDVYSLLDGRSKTAVELLLFVLGGRELESVDEMEDFYLQERAIWSQKLDLRLRKLDRKDPVIDKLSLVEEEQVN